jgi:hypothetical protein
MFTRKSTAIFGGFDPNLVHAQSIPKDLREKTCSEGIKKIYLFNFLLVVVCAREDTETRFKEAPVCAFGNRS